MTVGGETPPDRRLGPGALLWFTEGACRAGAARTGRSLSVQLEAAAMMSPKQETLSQPGATRRVGVSVNVVAVAE